MENQRLFLIIGIAIIGIMLFKNWGDFQAQTDKKPNIEKSGRPSISKESSNDNKKVVDGNNNDSVADVKKSSATDSKKISNDVSKASPTDRPSLTKNRPAVRSGAFIKSESKGRIKITTDVFSIEIDKLGADIRQVDLLKYSVSKNDKSPFRIMLDKSSRYYVTESGFDMDKGLDFMAPATFRKSTYTTTTQNNYQLENGKNSVSVDFVWTSSNGVKVVKTFTFFRGRYDINVKYKVINHSKKVWFGAMFQQITRAQYADSGQSMFLPTYMGGAIHTKEEGYEKFDFSEIKENDMLTRKDLESTEEAWVAMLQHYFVGAWILSKEDLKKHTKVRVFSSYDATRVFYSLVMRWTPKEIKPGNEQEFSARFYVGPKDQVKMGELAKGLDLTVDYGILSIISKLLFWLLTMFHSVIGNWGFAIILLTILVKGIFFKLSATSYRSMAKMRKLNPRMKQLKERHGDNRQAYSMAIQEMFKKEKVNPLGGCLPILVQIPVFIALYWVLLESVELRQAPFIFWIQDLSTKDPFFILPILMGVTMFLQHKLNPPQLDPMQQKIMMALPIVFTVFFMFFSSGLVLYWLVNNILSISQQWYITKQTTGEENLFS
ncbi:Inner membrane protein translocase and chaperone YidC, long form [hydrothermal vent metagenome]|uniref:Membrane protein insertase YidC n=1 Tax=hydrothermal vent metagenome TaxID=652676 RepID=A0A3B0YT99_9ZZZZ